MDLSLHFSQTIWTLKSNCIASIGQKLSGEWTPLLLSLFVQLLRGLCMASCEGEDLKGKEGRGKGGLIQSKNTVSMESMCVIMKNRNNKIKEIIGKWSNIKQRREVS